MMKHMKLTSGVPLSRGCEISTFGISIAWSRLFEQDLKEYALLWVKRAQNRFDEYFSRLL